MTANPYVHMGGLSLIVFAILGFAWGMMPVNPSRFRHRRWGDAIVAGAGPAMNILIAFVCLTSVGIWQGMAPTPVLEQIEIEWQTRVQNFLLLGGWLNLILCLLNLIPVPPLDGSRILASFSWKIRELYRHPQAQLFGLFLFLVIFMGGIADGALSWTLRGAGRYVAAVANLFS